jgi:hypothetical protein
MFYTTDATIDTVGLGGLYWEKSCRLIIGMEVHKCGITEA